MAASASGVNRFYVVLGAGALVGAAALVYLVTRPKAVSIPANVAVLAADTAGFRGYTLGADSAEGEVSEAADGPVIPGPQADVGEHSRQRRGAGRRHRRIPRLHPRRRLGEGGGVRVRRLRVSRLPVFRVGPVPVGAAAADRPRAGPLAIPRFSAGAAPALADRGPRRRLRE